MIQIIDKRLLENICQKKENNHAVIEFVRPTTGASEGMSFPLRSFPVLS